MLLVTGSSKFGAKNYLLPSSENPVFSLAVAVGLVVGLSSPLFRKIQATWHCWFSMLSLLHLGHIGPEVERLQGKYSVTFVHSAPYPLLSSLYLLSLLSSTCTHGGWEE